MLGCSVCGAVSPLTITEDMYVYALMCVSEGVESCSCGETASFPYSEVSHAFTGGGPAWQGVRPLIVWCWNTLTDEEMPKLCICLFWMIPEKLLRLAQTPCCALVFRVWRLAGSPVVRMPEHVSGERVPSMNLSWAWTENRSLLWNQLSAHHARASVKGITVTIWWESLPRGSVCFFFLFFFSFLSKDTFYLANILTLGH